MKSNSKTDLKISSLLPARNWQIIIDETGQLFSPEAAHAAESNPDLGKVVALITSENSELQPISSSFHAVRSHTDDVLSVLNNLLTSKEIATFGFTVKQPELIGISWVNAVTLLVRWICKLIPLQPNETNRLSFFIEQRQQYQAGTDLRALSETILTSLKGAFPNRYEKTKLTIEFITKDGHPYNGYADALAYLWGSSKPKIKDFLARSKLLGTCFIQANDEVLERLYLALHEHHKFLPEDWYSLLAAAYSLDRQTLLHEALTELGGIVSQQPERWSQYVQYLNYLQHTKQYTPIELYNAYTWLREYYPEDCPPESQFHVSFISGEIAAENHLGLIDIEHAHSALEVAQELAYDDMPQATQLVLRAAVTYTNALQFESAFRQLSSWAEFPTIALGRLNSAKLKSSLGQCAAFLGDFDAAIRYFDEAQLTILQLTDQRTRQRDLLQIQHYKSIVEMDQGKISESSVSNLMSKAGLPINLVETAKTLAKADTDQRFIHYLWLRICFKDTQFGAKYFPIYKANDIFWQNQQGHPWSLIEFYRAYLTWKTSKNNTLLHRIYEQTKNQEHGFTLRWISRVHHAIAAKILEMPLDLEADTEFEELDNRYLMPFMKSLQTHSETSLHIEIDKLLRSSIPFNFH